MGTLTHYRIAASSFFFIQGLVYSSWVSRIPDIKAALGLNNAEFGGILLSLPAGQLSAMALSGYLVNRFGSRPMAALASILYPSALINLSLASNAWQFMLFGFLFGMCGNLSNISVNTQGVGIERLYASSIMASFHGLWSVGAFFASMISLLMVRMALTPTAHFCLVLAIAASLLAVMYRSMLPRDRKPPKTQPSTGQKTGGGILRNKYILLLGVIAFASMLCEGTMFNWSALYFENVIRTKLDYIRYGYIAFTFTMTCGRFMADRLVTRFGVVRMLQASGAVIMAGLLMAVLFPSLIPCIIGFALVGLGTSSIVPLCYSMAGRSSHIAPGTAIATVSSIGFFGFMVGPPLIGSIAEVSSFRYSFALVAAIGLGITLLAPRVRGR